MSTTIKRVALVAVAALGLGVMSVAPSSAVPQADSLTLSASTGSTVVGTAVKVNATVAFLQETSSDSMTVTLSYVEAPAGIAVTEVGINSPATAATTDAGTPTVDTTTPRSAKVSAAAAAFVNKTLEITLTPSKAGTYVIRVTPTITGSAVAPAATAKTWTVTVAARTIGWRNAFVTTDTTTAAVVADVASITSSAAAKIGSVARVRVAQGYGTTAFLETATSGTDQAAVVVTTDKGLVSKTNDFTAGSKSVTTVAGTAAPTDYYVFSNGDVGAASITVTVGGVLVSTKTVTFQGAATTLAAALKTGEKSFIAPLGTAIINVTSKDSAGSAVTNPSGLTATSSDTAVATVGTLSGTEFTITGVAAGTATITVKDPATTGAATSATYVVTVAPAKSASAPVISFDKSAYGVGELVTMTISSTMADSATANLFTTALVFSAGNIVWVGTTPGATHAMVGGKVAYTFYAPVVSGTFTVTGTTGADVALTTAAVVSKTVDIVNPGADAAVDAANEAAQAASDATDAALAAADAADAATAAAQDAVDAVAALSAEVNTLIKALKAQITTLTNLVIKIQKKVKA
jgi:hypothetical protein